MKNLRLIPDVHKQQAIVKLGFAYDKAGSIVSISTNLNCEVPTQITSLDSSPTGARFSSNVNNEITHESTNLRDDQNRQLKIYPNPVEGFNNLRIWNRSRQ